MISCDIIINRVAHRCLTVRAYPKRRCLLLVCAGKQIAEFLKKTKMQTGRLRLNSISTTAVNAPSFLALQKVLKICPWHVTDRQKNLSGSIAFIHPLEKGGEFFVLLFLPIFLTIAIWTIFLAQRLMISVDL